MARLVIKSSGTGFTAVKNISKSKRIAKLSTSLRLGECTCLSAEQKKCFQNCCPVKLTVTQPNRQ